MDWDTRTATEYGVIRTFATILTGGTAAAGGGTEIAGHPGDKWGFAVQGALSIKNIPTGPGDTINMTAVYTDAATAYNLSFLTPAGRRALWQLGRCLPGLALYAINDVTFTNGSALESVKSWGLQRWFHPQLVPDLGLVDLRVVCPGEVRRCRRSHDLRLRSDDVAPERQLQSELQPRDDRRYHRLDSGQEPGLHG